ncbi:MAG: hypothetical protein PHV21_07915, partial [Synergistaceae bacterium]|nr:hypothetical protein [Synergistaceae bacterium]
NLSPDRKKNKLTLKPTTIVFEHTSTDLEPNPDDPNFTLKRSKSIQKFPAVTVSYNGKTFTTAYEGKTELLGILKVSLNDLTDAELKELDAKVQKLDEEINKSSEMMTTSFPLMTYCFDDGKKTKEYLKSWYEKDKQSNIAKGINFDERGEVVLVRLADHLTATHLSMLMGLADRFVKYENPAPDPDKMPTIYFTLKDIADCMGYVGRLESKHKKVIINALQFFYKKEFDIFYEVPKRDDKGNIVKKPKYQKDVIYEQAKIFTMKMQLADEYKKNVYTYADRIKKAKGFYITPNEILFAELDHFFVDIPKNWKQQILRITKGTRVSDLQAKLYFLLFLIRTEIYKNYLREKRSALKRKITPPTLSFRYETDVSDLADRMGLADDKNHKARRENQILAIFDGFKQLKDKIILSYDLQNNGTLTIDFNPIKEPIRKEKRKELPSAETQKTSKKSEPSGGKSEPSGGKSEPSGDFSSQTPHKH